MSDPLPLLPANLVPLRGESEPAVELNRPVTLIGRSRDCDVIINRPSISKVHAIILNDGYRILLRDLLSSGGTRVRGRSVHETVLQPQDAIRFGSFGFQYAGPSPGRLDDSPDIWLTLQDPENHVRWRFARRIVLIGSHEGCDVLLPRTGVATLHAVIARLGERFIVARRLNPHARLTCNNETIRYCPLEAGDELTLGSATLRVEFHGQVAGESGNMKAIPTSDGLEWSQAGVGTETWWAISASSSMLPTHNQDESDDDISATDSGERPGHAVDR